MMRFGSVWILSFLCSAAMNIVNQKMSTRRKPNKKKEKEKGESIAEQTKRWIREPTPELLAHWSKVRAVPTNNFDFHFFGQELKLATRESLRQKLLSEKEAVMNQQTADNDEPQLSWMMDFCHQHDRAKEWMQEQIVARGFKENPVPLFDPLSHSMCFEELEENVWQWYELLCLIK